MSDRTTTPVGIRPSKAPSWDGQKPTLEEVLAQIPEAKALASVALKIAQQLELEIATEVLDRLNRAKPTDSTATVPRMTPTLKAHLQSVKGYRVGSVENGSQRIEEWVIEWGHLGYL